MAMEAEARMVTVFRSADVNANEQASTAIELLRDAGIPAEVYDDKFPGVPEGVVEVKVPENWAEQAQDLIQTQGEFIAQPYDTSEDLEMVPVFSSQSADAELMALEIRSLLEAHGIPSMLVGASTFPNLPFEVRVPKIHFEEARQVLAAAAEAGPAGAEEAERDSEAQGGAEPAEPR